MFQEPKILPWLARKAGVPFPEAREIWRSIATQCDAEGSTRGDDAQRQIRELRRQLKERGCEAHSAGVASSFDWMYPLPLFQTWAECQTRIVLNTWLAWAETTRSARRWTSFPSALGS